MDQYYLRAVRIAAKTKLTDRWIHSQWYQPLDAEDAGTTFVLIEVVNPWFPAPQITTTITNTFNREYFRARRVSSSSEAFEVAVRRVNEALAARADDGETDWIGNLHAILAVVAGAEFHLVAAGKAVAYLLRAGAANPLIEPKETQEPLAPLHTFTSMATGSLEVGDKGVLATPDLLEYLSPADLTTALAQPIDPAAREIVKHLQEKRVKTPHAVLFDLSATPHPERTREESETVFLDVPLIGSVTRMKSAATGAVFPALRGGVKATGSAAGWFWGRAKERLAPGGRLARRPAEEPAGPLVTAPPTERSLPTTTLDSSPPPAFLTKPAGRLASVMNWLSGRAASLKLRSRLLFIGLAIVLLAVVGLRLLSAQRTREAGVAEGKAQEALAAAQAKKEEADLAVIYKENDKAIGLYVEALTLATTARQNARVAPAAEEVFTAAQQSLDELTGTTRITETDPYAQFTNPMKVAMVGTTPWVVEGDGSVLAAPPAGQRVTGQTLTGLGTIIGLGYIPDNQTLFAVGTTGVGLIRTQDGSGTTLSPPADGWKKAAAIEAYATTLYFLDTSDGQIWKYTTNRDGVVDPPVTYFADEVALTKALDLAIDGRIYVLSSDGTIDRYFKGAAEDFTVSGLPKPNEQLVKPTLLATDAEAAGVYVFDSSDKRIVELDKTGAYLRQFALPENWDVKDFSVSGTEKKIWVLAGNNVYEIAL